MTRIRERRNPDNPDEFWCNCPRHKCYIHKSNFGKASNRLYGLATICKLQHKEYVAAHKLKAARTAEDTFLFSSSRLRLDRGKWANYKQYLQENPGYCKFVLGTGYDESRAKAVFEGRL